MVDRDPSKPWIEDYEYFREQCLIGKEFERFVAAKLKLHGLSVEVQDDGIRESIDQISGFTKTSGDLKINGWPFEVKSRNVRFTEPFDFPHWPMFVDTVQSYESKLVKPRGYIFVSQPTGALMGFSTKHIPECSKVAKFDRKRQIEDLFYCVDRRFVLREETLIERLKILPCA